MNRNRTLRLTLAAILVAVAVVGSMFSFPVFGSTCSPVPHRVNVVCGVLLGPWNGLGAGVLAALIRNLMG
ncbi:MAG: energy coupling factor transporter S component ThiW, partial [Clostridia bacterium]|nr:energy coupling factor transporter S component ThiW [Clostridia bacterium]